MRIRFTATALAEIEEILTYISAHDPSASIRVAEAIRQSIAWINTRPEASPIVYSSNVRAKLVGRFQYRVYYEIEGDNLIIRNVRSTRQQRPREES